MINLYNGEYLDNQSILDYSTKKNVNGYLIKDNIDLIIHIANRDILSNACSIEFYYYDTLNNRNLKIRTKDSYYVFDSVVNVIPNHTYNYLKNLNRLYGKTFVVKINYEKKTIKDVNASTYNEIETYIDTDYDIEPHNKCYYFKILSNEEYMAYKEIKEEADNFTIKKDGPVSIKNRK